MQANTTARQDSLHKGSELSAHQIGSRKVPEHVRGSLEIPATVRDTFENPSVQQADTRVLHEPRKVAPVHPGPRAQRAELLEYIKQQLDCYGNEPLLMNRYQLLGPDQRATGGELRFLHCRSSFKHPICTEVASTRFPVFDIVVNPVPSWQTISGVAHMSVQQI
jgi:hypothetical protein